MASEHDNKLRAQPEPRGNAPAAREPATQEQQVTVVATSLKLRNWLQLPRFLRVNGQDSASTEGCTGPYHVLLGCGLPTVAFFYTIGLER